MKSVLTFLGHEAIFIIKRGYSRPDQPSKVKDRIKLCSLQKVRNNEAHGESREPERILLSYAAASSAICSCGVRSSNGLRSRSTA